MSQYVNARVALVPLPASEKALEKYACTVHVALLPAVKGMGKPSSNISFGTIHVPKKCTKKEFHRSARLMPSIIRETVGRVPWFLRRLHFFATSIMIRKDPIMERAPLTLAAMILAKILLSRELVIVRSREMEQL
mmetsp:Transcript_25758/g.49523  ORF Transcript_25758/g.49523 Transcript_25758/m.49523 type:complete len:135 (-) Transcript_25758:90-494(-)